ncbi:peptidoglycan-recognition protein LF-like [Macrosteles quadrilineatus]|uniref:peptidoglycan-recognition protein LF-like n=1 Tax=Macrosteles quadrilineatus TaxID=74068 RepID=UPI0023E092A9|nr:peptidoglycan-recognition protein LF-like [Macrosteles quadrilineatus]XP_054264952.1 peptidoglycan-recognition protein LF-like [Macrosteles quadrilineatus]
MNKKGLREDHFIPSEVEEGDHFRGGSGPFLEADPSRFNPDTPTPYTFNWRKRNEWGSPPEFEEDEGIMAKHPLEGVIMTFIGSKDTFYEVDCKYYLLNLRDDLKKKGMYEIPWNFVVGGDGTVYTARGWDRLPEPHPEEPEMNGKSIEIGHFGTRGTLPPNEAQIASAWEVVEYGIKEKYLIPEPERSSFFYA